jgi:hypothetical protein
MTDNPVKAALHPCHAGPAEGPNMMHKTVWDLHPDSGGEPVREYLWATDAAERVERDPERYSYTLPETERERALRELREAAE